MKPHFGQDILQFGPSIGEGRGVLILVHGRGASAENILELAPHFQQDDFTYLAPAAAGHTWYPNSFLAPIATNEPGISSGIYTLLKWVEQVEASGVGKERIVLGGFSQGACLTSEFVARHPARYGGLLAFSGGLIGPPDTPRDYAGDLAGTPVFLGCSDVDPHIPKWRVEESAQVLEQMGASVQMKLYPNLPHTINADELLHARQILQQVGKSA